MFDFIKMQLIMNRLTLEQVKLFVGVWLTTEEYNELLQEFKK